MDNHSITKKTDKIVSVGIDVSKSKLDVFILKEKESTHINISNDTSGVEVLLGTLGVIQAPIIIESTSTYHLEAALILKDKGLDVRVINPFVFKSYFNMQIRKTKTDKIDCKLLAQLGTKEEDLQVFNLTAEEIENKKIFRLKESLIKTRSQYKNKLRNIQSTTKKVDLSYEEKFLKDFIKSLTQQIKELEKEVLKKMQNQLDKLGKIEGISAVALSGVLIEIGDIDKFPNDKTLIAFCGIDPSTRQSGSSVHTQGSLSKRGSSVLRKLIFLIGWGLMMHNDKFTQYYDKKRLEGKHYYSCLMATGRKFLVILFKLLKSGQKYNPNL